MMSALDHPTDEMANRRGLEPAGSYKGLSLARFSAALRRHGPLRLLSRAVAPLFDMLYTLIYCAVLGVEVGRGTIIKPGARLRRQGGRIVIGRNGIVHPQASILAHGGDILIGDRFSLNPFSILYGHGGVRIGNDVLIAAASIVIPANHGFAPGAPIRGQKLTMRGIEIGDDVWLGAGVRVLDGSVVETGAVLAAGAVVAGSQVPANAIFGGVPARQIGTRS